MFAFEVKRSKPIYFGNLLSLWKTDALLGNYLVSLVDVGKENATPEAIVIHHENVDPNLLIHQRQTDDIKRDDAESFEEYERPLLSSLVEIFDKAAGRLLGSGYPAWIERISEALENVGKSQGSIEPSSFSNGVYFMVDSYGSNFWGEEPNIKTIVPENYDKFCQLEADGSLFGVAFDPKEIFSRKDVQFVLFNDSRGRCYAILVLDSMSFQCLACKKLGDRCSVVFRGMEEVLYGDEYRSYFKDGQQVENQYYGDGCVGGFDFARLPDQLFAKLLLYLPWRERAQCRRVSNRWLAASNMALSLSTKVVDGFGDQFRGMQRPDFKRLLPIVAETVESIRVDGELYYEFLLPVPAFRSLRCINFNYCTNKISCDHFYAILDKCPNLREVTVNFPSGISSDRRKVYDLDKLRCISISSVGGDHCFEIVADPQLRAISEIFPKLSWLRIDNGTLSSSCLASFVERCGHNLTHFEVNGFGYGQQYAPIGIFTGMERCQQLDCLSLTKIDVISDVFLAAVSTGCLNLTTLNMEGSKLVTNQGLTRLATLPKLKRLNISMTGDNCSEAVAHIAREGRLEELLATGTDFALGTLKTCIRFCQNLKLLVGCDDNVSTVDEAVEVAELYGRQIHAVALLVWSRNGVWRDERVKEVQNQIRQRNAGYGGRWIIDRRRHREGFLENRSIDNASDPDIIEDQHYYDDDYTSTASDSEYSFDDSFGGGDFDGDDYFPEGSEYSDMEEDPENYAYQ